MDLAKENELSLADWDNTWKSDQAFWHRKEPHQSLVKYYDKIVTKDTKRVFLPLCGKSVDLLWLANRNLEVVGLEFSEVAVKAVFEEGKSEYTVKKEGQFNVYHSNDLPLTIYAGDYFDFSNKVAGTFDAIWDRGGFTAINSKRRQQYADSISFLLNPNGKILLFSTFYKSATFGGPPYPATPDDVKKYYKNLNFEHFSSETGPNTAFNIDAYTRNLYLLSKC